MESIENFLKVNFDSDIFEVKPIDGGERSKVFLFTSKGKKYIFRRNSQNVGFIKDKYANENFGNYIPIPKILKIGLFEDGYFAISDFCEGVPLQDGGEKLSDKLAENLLDTLDKIKTSPMQGRGYGMADIKGNATYETWSDWVLKDNTPVTRDGGNYFTWEDIKNITFVDKKIIENIFENIKMLSPVIPNERYLIHGDFGPGNVIINGDKVAGVIDWNESGYGDFLYDVAWLDFWIKNTDFARVFKIHSEKNGLIIPNYEDRMRCHKLFIGLTALGIYSAINLEENYFEVLGRVKSIIDL